MTPTPNNKSAIPKFIVQKSRTHKTVEGKEMTITTLRPVTANAPCKSCRLKQRENGSSRCVVCSAAGKLFKK